jgi:hypothetical protein
MSIKFAPTPPDGPVDHKIGHECSQFFDGEGVTQGYILTDIFAVLEAVDYAAADGRNRCTGSSLVGTRISSELN